MDRTLSDDGEQDHLTRWNEAADKLEQRLFDLIQPEEEPAYLEANACALHNDYTGTQHNCVACNLAGQVHELRSICKVFCGAEGPSEEGKVQALLYFANPIVDSCALIYEVVGFKPDGFEELLSLIHISEPTRPY